MFSLQQCEQCVQNDMLFQRIWCVSCQMITCVPKLEILICFKANKVFLHYLTILGKKTLQPHLLQITKTTMLQKMSWEIKVLKLLRRKKAGLGLSLPERSCLIRPLLALGSMGRKSLYQVISGSGLPLAAQSMVAVRVRSTTLSWGPMSMLGKPGGSRSSVNRIGKEGAWVLWLAIPAVVTSKGFHGKQ